MSTQDNIADSGLLLGMAGWPRPDWEGGYFPEDLPQDWQFGYYSNDADCLLLRAGQWRGIDPDELEDWLQDVDEAFRFYVEAAEGVDEQVLETMGPHLGGLLVENFRQIDRRWPQFRPDASGYWLDHEGQPRVRVLDDLPLNLREQRMLLEHLPVGLQALIIADIAADPGLLADMRKVAQLLGIA